MFMKHTDSPETERQLLGVITVNTQESTIRVKRVNSRDKPKTNKFCWVSPPKRHQKETAVASICIKPPASCATDVNDVGALHAHPSDFCRVKGQHEYT